MLCTMPRCPHRPDIAIASAASSKALAADRSGRKCAGAALCRQLLLSLLLVRTSRWTSDAEVVLLRVCWQTFCVLPRGFGGVGGSRVWWCVADRGARCLGSPARLPSASQHLAAHYP